MSAGITLPLLGHVTVGGVIVGVIVGVAFGSQIRRIPGVSKIPMA
jgi:hypothetical protein